MSGVVLSKAYADIPIDEREVLRYAGCRAEEPEIMKLLHECMAESADKLAYRLCYRETELAIIGDKCDFGVFTLRSEKLAAHLQGCGRAVIFAATVGVGIDRLIAKYGRVSPSKALMLQALGAERIEAVCDEFCNELKEEYGGALKSRFSPGYGDLSLDCQKDFFSVLDCERRIGLTLNSSGLMSPSKSVTAIVGIGCSDNTNREKCSSCVMKDCTFRSAL